MSALPLPIQHAQDVVEAMAHDTPVVIFCMSCSRSKKQDPYLIASKLGPVPFGFLVNAFACKQCSERLAVVLPWYAPIGDHATRATPLQRRHSAAFCVARRSGCSGLGSFGYLPQARKRWVCEEVRSIFLGHKRRGTSAIYSPDDPKYFLESIEAIDAYMVRLSTEIQRQEVTLLAAAE